MCCTLSSWFCFCSIVQSSASKHWPELWHNFYCFPFDWTTSGQSSEMHIFYLSCTVHLDSPLNVCFWIRLWTWLYSARTSWTQLTINLILCRQFAIFLTPSFKSHCSAQCEPSRTAPQKLIRNVTSEPKHAPQMNNQPFNFVLPCFLLFSWRHEQRKGMKRKENNKVLFENIRLFIYEHLVYFCRIFFRRDIVHRASPRRYFNLFIQTLIHEFANKTWLENLWAQEAKTVWRDFRLVQSP